MRKSLLLLSAALLAALGAQAQDDDVYFVPSAKDKAQKTDTYTARPYAGRSSYSTIGGGEETTYDTWADGRTDGGRDVDEYNRRGGASHHNCDTAQTSADYDEGYEDGYEDGVYTSRLVRFWSPRAGVYVSSPYYWNWYDYAYDPFYYGYGSPWSYGWSGWWGWGSWYGWRPYYSSWYSWGAWHDPWWGWGGGLAHHPHWGWDAAPRPAAGGNWRMGNARNLFANTSRGGRTNFSNTSRQAGQWSGTRTQRGSFGNSRGTAGWQQGTTRGQRTVTGTPGNFTRGQRTYNNNTFNSNRQFDRSIQNNTQRQSSPGTFAAPSRSSAPSGGRGGGGFGGGFGGGRGGRVGSR